MVNRDPDPALKMNAYPHPGEMLLNIFLNKMPLLKLNKDLFNNVYADLQ
jgi:hypothetical protein